MAEENFEKPIFEFFQNLPKKHIIQGDKQRVWLKIEKYILEAKTMFKPKASLWDVFLLRNSWVRAVAIVIIVLIALSLAGGAAKANPGQALYPVKKVAEKVEIALATNSETKVKITIKHAKRRLEEVQFLVSKDQQNGVVSRTLTALTDTTQSVVAASADKPELRDQIFKLATEEEKILTTVQSQTQGELHQAIAKALTLTKESLDQLASKDSVQGASTITAAEQNSAGSQATSTVKELSKPSAVSGSQGAAAKESAIEANIQINSVIKIRDGQEIPVE